jgi:phenylpropionate dioxygenase-like ring-hydroxylating dioxygenase large terminal subunit
MLDARASRHLRPAVAAAKDCASGGAPPCAWYPVSVAERAQSAQALLFGRQLTIASRLASVHDAHSGARLAGAAHGGLIWACADAAVEQAPPLIDLGPFNKCAPFVVTTKVVRASFDQAVLGLVDAAHVPVVHKSWWWRKQHRPRKVKTKDYAPMPYGFRAKAHGAAQSAVFYKLLGSDPTATIEFCLPGCRLERIESRNARLYNLTTVTPLAADLCALSNMMYSDTPALRLAGPLLGWVGGLFLAQDQRILDLTQDLSPNGAAMLFVGDPDEPSRWYYALKRELRRAQCSGAPFENPVRASQLQWRT